MTSRLLELSFITKKIHRKCRTTYTTVRGVFTAMHFGGLQINRFVPEAVEGECSSLNTSIKILTVACHRCLQLNFVYYSYAGKILFCLLNAIKFILSLTNLNMSNEKGTHMKWAARRYCPIKHCVHSSGTPFDSGVKFFR